ncbi:tail fiber domain-containing protein [Roseivirga sp. UBA1976]|uniref:tail fiber domain-containing protein n=1 Tax=Roseivirga sp. UBA1976 TaxID=1947386 RepID=UPI00257FE887|nr:tail fiber domain-containing protein [Roseivirga sp. UBA1976]MEC7754272.1 tail fiber domain-containing protein [Bacteroidota bacterium]
MKKRLLLVLSFALVLGIPATMALPLQDGAAQVQEGKKMSFQGTLYENGTPVTGERNFTFLIDLGEGNSWTETQSNVQIIEGLYAVTLGSVNPMPEDLFHGVSGRTLTVSIGNTVLGTTELLAPFSPKPIGPTDDLPRRISIDNSTTDSDTIFYFNISSDNLNRGTQRGIQVDMTGAGFKTALRGNVISLEGNEQGGIAIIGSAIGQGNGSHEGVRGQAFGAGRNNAGVLGLAGGPGNGATGYEEGSYNNGVVGYGQSNPWGNTGVSGWALGNVGVDNIGVAGISAVGGEDNTEIENKGILGRAEGYGINKAIWGRAMNGVENWAGWFEGDVAVHGGNNLNVYGSNPEDSIKVQLNYYEPNHSGSVLTFGHNKTRRSLIGSDSYRTGGLLHLYDSLDRAMAQLRATGRIAEWVADQHPHGQLSLWGNTSQNFYMGARVWEEGGSDLPVLQMFGKRIENPDNPGNFSPMEGVFMSIQDFGDGKQQGLLQLGKEGEAAAVMSKDNLQAMLNIVDHNSKTRLEVNEQNSGSIKLMSAVDSVNVLIDSNGEKAGLIHLNDSLGRANMRMLTYSGGGAYLEQHAGISEIGETRVTYQLVGNANPWSNMIARNADGTAKGRVQSGWLPGGGEEIGQFRISDGSNRTLAQMFANGTTGGRLALEGPSSSNFFMGGKDWENADLAFFAMRGATSVNDGNGGSYFPDLIALNINQKDGVDYGSFDMNNSSYSSINLGVKSWESDGLKKPIFQMMSDFEKSDGNGGTYRPSLVDMQVNISNAGTYSGDFNLNSSAGTGIRMYGGADFNNDASDVYSHIALDGLNNNHIYLDGNGNGDFTGNISAVSINQTSDARLKTNVSTLTSGLAMVNSLRGVRYNWKDTSRPENKIGFIAQEVEKVAPELVITKEDGFKAVNYGEMTALLVEAVKELTAQVEALKAENGQLKAEANKVEALEERLAKIEALLLNTPKTVNADQK